MEMSKQLNFQCEEMDKKHQKLFIQSKDKICIPVELAFKLKYNPLIGDISMQILIESKKQQFFITDFLGDIKGFSASMLGIYGFELTKVLENQFSVFYFIP